MHFKCNKTHWEFAKQPTEAIGTIFRNIFLLGVCLGRVWGAELSVRWVKLSPFINCDYVRWPRDIGKCIQRTCVIFGLFLIPISWISANFCLRIIFHQWMMMEDLGRWWKMTYGHWKMYSKVLCHLWIVFGCPAALYSLMSHQVGVGQKIYQLYMPSYQNRSCSVCLQDVYLTFLDSRQ